MATSPEPDPSNQEGLPQHDPTPTNFLYVRKVSGSHGNYLGGTIMLRLTLTAQQAKDGSAPPASVWTYVLRTRRPKGTRNVMDVREPFHGRVPSSVLATVTSSFDSEVDPDDLAGELLAYVTNWQRPPEPLTRDQQDWFNNLAEDVREEMSIEGGAQACARAWRQRAT
jgi:hypothetical protein